jgi:hypothetical protein
MVHGVSCELTESRELVLVEDTPTTCSVDILFVQGAEQFPQGSILGTTQIHAPDEVEVDKSPYQGVLNGAAIAQNL